MSAGRRGLTGNELLALCAVLVGLIAIALPELGSDPWPFRPATVDPDGILAPLVRAAGEEWDVGIARAVAFVAALGVALLAAIALRRETWPRWVGWGLVLVVGLMLLAPSTLLQVGLRESTAPWFHTNDSTYQIELAGDLVLDGDNPYGHDYRRSGLERFYSFDGSAGEREREVALRHLAYFPGTVVTGAAWRLLPAPLDDYRVLVLLSTLGLLGAVMLFRAPLSWRLILGAVLVANPIALRSSWFGQNDAPSLLLVVLAFALATRGRAAWAAAAIAGAVLLKQFALVAVPFLAVVLVKRGFERAELRRAAIAFGGVIAVCMLPFFLADPGAFWDDTVKYGAGTYKIVGYGLSAMLLRLGILEERDGSYPFVLFALVLWLPVTAYLLLQAWRAREAWHAAAGFAVSILVLLFIGRTFNNYYLVWPMTGAVIAALMAFGEQTRTDEPEPSGTSASSPPPRGLRTSPG